MLCPAPCGNGHEARTAFRALWSRLLMPDDEDMPQPSSAPSAERSAQMVTLPVWPRRTAEYGYSLLASTRAAKREAMSASLSVLPEPAEEFGESEELPAAAAEPLSLRLLSAVLEGPASCPSLVPAAADGAVLPAAEGAAGPVCTGTPPSTCAAVAGAESTGSGDDAAGLAVLAALAGFGTSAFLAGLFSALADSAFFAGCAAGAG